MSYEGPITVQYGDIEFENCYINEDWGYVKYTNTSGQLVEAQFEEVDKVFIQSIRDALDKPFIDKIAKLEVKCKQCGRNTDKNTKCWWCGTPN